MTKTLYIIALLTVAALALSNSTAEAAGGYSGVMGGGDTQRSSSSKKEAPSYGGLIAPSESSSNRRTQRQAQPTPQKQKEDNLETYAEFQAALEKERKKKAAEERAVYQQLEPMFTSPVKPQTEPPLSRGIGRVIEPVTGGIGVFEPEKITEEQRTVLSQMAKATVKGKNPIEYGISKQVEGILKEANRPGMSKEDREAARKEAEMKLSRLQGGMRMRNAVSDDLYTKMGLPEDMVKHKIEGNKKALIVVEKALQKIQNSK